MPWVIDREYRGEWPQEPRAEHALIAHIDPDHLKAGEVVWSLIYVDLAVARQGVDAVRAAETYLAAPKFKNAPAAAALDAGDGGQSPATDTSPVAGDVQPTGDTTCDTESTVGEKPSDGSTLPPTSLSGDTPPSSTSSGTTNSTNSPEPSTTSSPTSHADVSPTDASSTPSPTSSATTGVDRDDLRRRVAALDPEQRARFDAHGFGRDTPTEVIAAALDDLAGFGQVAPLAEPAPEPPAHEPRRPVHPGEVDHLVERVRASNVKDVINAWMVEGNRAGHPWNVMSSPYVDNWERTRAALHLAVQCSDTDTRNVDTDIVRELLRAAIGDTAAEWPTVPIGAVIGQLTIDQARHAYNLADAFGTVVLPTWDADGHLQLSGVEAVAA